MKKYLISLILLFFSPFTVQAWWDAGHMAVAQIAYERLRPDVKEQVDKLSDTFSDFYPKHHDFVSISCWADSIREHFHLFDQLHYTNFPHDPDNILSDEKKQQLLEKISRNDVIWLINQAKQTLQNPAGSRFEKALVLHLLVHTAADIHQPLHTTSLYDSTHSEGDQGGNFFFLKAMPVANLHALWDSGVGLLPQIRFPANQEALDVLKKWTQDLTTKYPQTNFPQRLNLDPYHWALESHELAVSVVYDLQENSIPEDAYIAKAQEVAARRIALAGYRLAELLNTLLGTPIP